MESKQRKRDILNETLEYLNNNPQCISERGCLYSGKHINTEGCAIGRYFKPEERILIDEYYLKSGKDNDVRLLFKDYKKIGVNIPEKLKGIDISFLEKIQYLHDNVFYSSDEAYKNNYIKKLKNDVKFI